MVPSTPANHLLPSVPEWAGNGVSLTHMGKLSPGEEMVLQAECRDGGKW